METGIRKTDKGYEVLIPGVDGAQAQKFTGDSADEVLAKLVTAQENATRKIAEQKRLIKTTSAGTPDQFRRAAKFEAREIGKEEAARISLGLQDPENAAEAIRTVFEASVGASVEEVRTALANAQRVALRSDAERQGAQFMREHPSFLASSKNDQTMLEYLAAHNMAYTARNLALAYEDLNSSGLLEIEQEKAATPSPELAETKPRPRLAMTGIPAGRASASAPSTGRPRLTADQITRMSPEEFKKRWEDPMFQAELNKMDFGKSVRPRI